MKLVIGDKNSSSWSMRPWLVLRHFDIPFEEVLIRLGQPDTKETIRRYSPSCKVPCLITDSGEAVWESLAIIETLAECFPQLAMWPRDAAARARARSISAEMHGGFADMLENVARIDEIWRECLAAHGGPFLFGEFSIADAMFAPVAMRFNSYAPPLGDEARAYVKRLTALPAVAAWIEGAARER
jgi:glutathione S-transferase